MSKLTFEQADNLSKGGTMFFKLSDGESKSVRFLYNTPSDIEIYGVHEFTGTNFATIECSRNEGDAIDTCKWCASGNKTKAVVVIPLFVVEENQIEYWKRSSKWVKDNLIPLFSTLPANAPISGQTFILGRNGKTIQDTVYTVAPDMRVPNDMKTKDGFGQISSPLDLNIIRPNDYDFNPSTAAAGSNTYQAPTSTRQTVGNIF